MTVLSFFGFYILFATRFRCWLATLFKSGASSEEKGNDEIMSKKSSVMSLLLKLHIRTHLNKCTHAKFVCNDSYVTSGLLLSSFSIRSLSLFSFHFYWFETVNAFPVLTFCDFPSSVDGAMGHCQQNMFLWTEFSIWPFHVKWFSFSFSLCAAHPRPVPRNEWWGRVCVCVCVPSFFRSIKCLCCMLCAFLRIHAKVKNKINA